jgi:hypothetical protein
MAAPDAETYEDPFGDMANLPEPIGELAVEILAVIATPDELHRALAGWEDAMSTPGSVDWLRSRVRGSTDA